jgi:hypothetical protein
MTQLNPVVQKIAEQAKGFVDLNQHVGGDNGCMIYTYEGLNRFAELIVRECAKVSEDDITDGDACCTNTAYRIASQIKEHFGVE